MDLYIGIPLFTEHINELEARRSAVKDWFDKNKTSLKDTYRFANISLQRLCPAQELEIFIKQNNKIIITYPDLVTKGLAIRLHILTVLDWIDHKESSRRDDALYLMIDGRGAIDYSNIFLVLDGLSKVPKYDVVFGRRPPGDSGMAVWRKNIELFEEYLIYEKFGKDTLRDITGYRELPDSQAGCWGLRLGVMKRLPLTARSYEVEYDLLVSAIESKVRIGFTDPLKMNPRNTTDFGKEVDEASMKQCVTKMDFITHRLDLERKEIPRLLDKYLTEISQSEERMLPERYIQELRHFGFSSDV